MFALPAVTIQFLSRQLLPEAEKIILRFEGHRCATKGTQIRELSTESVDIRGLYDIFRQQGWDITCCNLSTDRKRKNPESALFVLQPICAGRQVRVVRGFRVPEAFCALTRESDWSMKVFESEDDGVRHTHIVFTQSDRPIRGKTQVLNVLNGCLYLSPQEAQEGSDDQAEQVAA